MKLKLLAAGVCLAAFAVSPLVAQQTTPAPAQAPPPAANAPDGTDAAPDRVRGRGRGALAACRADLAAHCAGIERGRAARVACLRQNEAKLAEDCRTTLAALGDGERSGRRRDRDGGPGARPGERAGGRLAACQADLSTLCAGADQANGGRMRCLRANQAKLSAECSQAIEALRSSRKGLRQACASERETICAKPGEGRGGLLGCLRQNAGRLSETCATTLASLPERGGMGRGRRGGTEPDNRAPSDGSAPQPPPAALR